MPNQLDELLDELAELLSEPPEEKEKPSWAKRVVEIVNQDGLKDNLDKTGEFCLGVARVIVRSERPEDFTSENIIEIINRLIKIILDQNHHVSIS